MRIPLAVAVALLVACSGGSRPPDERPAAPDAAAPARTDGDLAYVTAVAALRREPADANRVPGPAGKAVANVLLVLHRGEKVTVLESRDEWARVRASDEIAGWLKRSLLLPAQGVTEATLLAPTDSFDRPDLLALNSRRRIGAGTLLLVVRSRELFSEINVASGSSAWVLSDRLTASPRDVMVAKLVEKARWLKKSNRLDEARQVLALGRAQFSDVGLVQVLAEELGEGPPDGGVPLPGAQ
jgi:SH3-like domain-containing protein